jgi:hypothetical protein
MQMIDCISLGVQLQIGRILLVRETSWAGTLAEFAGVFSPWMEKVGI